MGPHEDMRGAIGFGNVELREPLGLLAFRSDPSANRIRDKALDRARGRGGVECSLPITKGLAGAGCGPASGRGGARGRLSLAPDLVADRSPVVVRTGCRDFLEEFV